MTKPAITVNRAILRRSCSHPPARSLVCSEKASVCAQLTEMAFTGSATRGNRWPSTVTALIGGLCAVILLSVSAVAAIYLWPRTPSKFEVVVYLTAPISSLASGQALRFVAPPRQAFVMIDGGGLNAAGKPTGMGWLVNTGSRFEALAADSSDDGCAVTFDAISQRFDDPCHGAAYAIDGHVLRGPATTSLAHLRWRVVAADRIAVEGLVLWAAV